MSKKMIVFLTNDTKINTEVALLCSEKYKDYTVLINPDKDSFKMKKKDFKDNIECITLRCANGDSKLESSSDFRPMNIVCRLGDQYTVEKALEDIFKTIERD